MKFQKHFSQLSKIFIRFTILLTLAQFFSCKAQVYSFTNEENQKQLNKLLLSQDLDPKQRYVIINQIANSLLAQQDYQGVILFLTEQVEKQPDDMYNSYWLLMTAHAYLSLGAEPVAE